MVKYNVNICDQIENELQVHFTKLCDNKCPFCVDALNKGLADSSGRPNVEAICQRISEHKGEVQSVGISGGEPMLFITQLLHVVRYIKTNTNLKVYIITSCPKQCETYRYAFNQILGFCDGMSITPQHYNEEVADQIRGHKSTFDRQAFYASIIDKDKVTMNINMVKPFLCDKDEICKCIEHYNAMGFKNIKLAEVFDRPEMDVSFEKEFGIKLKSPFAHGCKTVNFDITPWIPSFKGNLTLKRTCFLVNKCLHATLADTFKAATRSIFSRDYYFGVIYEDGSIHPYWV